MTIKLIITFVLMLFSQFLQAEITISVDRTPIVVDEAFQLVFATDQSVDSEPDFSPLNKSFTVLKTGRRTNTKIVNGKMTLSKQWILTVMANHAGVLTIPAIHFGKDVSQANTIKVIANVSPNKSANKGDLYLEVEVDTKTPYVQAQVVYTVKLYRAVQTNNASLSEPKINGGQAVINKLGEDKSFELHIKGKRYVVIQRQYTIFPQNSGALRIEPIVFQGQTGSGRFFGFDPFGPQPKSIVKRSSSINLEVKPIPDTFTGDTWLPASNLYIQEQWSVSPDKLQQGEATTRTLILTANGLVASNLPEIKSNLPEELKSYPDQPEFAEAIDEKGSIGIRHDKTAIIPIVAGDYLLPAIKIPWWNTVADKMEFAELPERMIHANISTTAPTNNVQQQPLEKENELVVKSSNEQSINVVEADGSQIFWQCLSLFLFILWISTLFILWQSKRKESVKDDKVSNELSNRLYLKQIKHACAINDVVLAKQALLDWSNAHWQDKNITSIDAIKEFCNEDLKLKIDELNTCLYGKVTNQWDGVAFFVSFKSQSFKNKKIMPTEGNLETLYKK